MTEKPNFCLIGSNTLLTLCLQHLIERRCHITAIFSDDPQVVNEAHAKGLATYPLHAIDALAQKGFTCDYLLSIYNPKILSAAALQCPRQCAINYHNALLPHYRGSNATAWAILNQEKKHGISWHKMTTALDQGPLLFQATLPILAEDTAVTLNMRCDQLAQKTLPRFLDQLLTNTLSCPQPPPLRHSNAQHVFSLADKPAHRGCLDWHQPACHIYAQCRGLCFGHYDNTIATPKFYYQNQVFIIENLTITTEQSPHIPPGNIIAVGDTLVVSTTTHNITITAIRCFDGTDITLSHFTARFSVRVGDALQFPPAWRRHAQQAITENHSEKFWVLQWSRIAVVNILSKNTYEQQPIKSNEKQATAQIVLPDDRRLFQKEAHITAALISTIAIYLCKHNQYATVSFLLDYSLVSPAAKAAKTNPLQARYIPFSIALSPDDTWDQVNDKVRTCMQQYHQKGPHLKDLFYRYKRLDKYTPTMIRVAHTDACPPDALTHEHAAPLITFLLSAHQCTLTIATTIPTSLCQAPYAQLIAQHITALWSHLCQNQQQKIRCLSLLTAQEKTLLVTRWSGKQNFHHYKKTLLAHFETITQQYPDKPAVVDQTGRTLCYAALKARATQLAVHLLSYAIAPGTGVCFYMESDIDAIIAMIAILQIQCYYIPLLRAYPIKLIHRIIQENRARIVLVAHQKTAQQLAQSLRGQNITIININAIAPLSDSLVNSLPITASMAAPAYVMYTSGSTGQAKGVMIPQKGILRLVKRSSFLQCQPHHHVLQSSNIAFDVATFLIWGSLLNGATLYTLQKSTLLDVNQFAHYLSANKIDIACLTARLFDHFAQTKPRLFHTLKHLLVGGDILNVQAIARTYQQVKNRDFTITNVYGPTENTTFTTTYPIKSTENYAQGIPIGQPINNTSLYVLDRYAQLQPIGMAGELYIGGDGLAKGYVGDNTLNQTLFVSHDTTSLHEPRLYRSGDRVFWQSDRQLAYLDRNDTQVKIRGYRVNLNVVNRVLSHCPGVHMAYVTLQTGDQGDKALYAFIQLDSPADDQCKAIATIRDHLSHELPVFMHPHITLVPVMPLNANGKIDKKKLLTQCHSNQDAQPPARAHTASAVAYTLTGIWREILGLRQFNDQDDFFAVGGNSLGIALLANAIKKAFQINISIATLLQHTTIHDQAATIEKCKQGGTEMAQKTHSDSVLIQQDLKQRIDCDLSHVRQHHPASHAQILLTGATGLLGKYVLGYLLDHTDAIIHCLVRHRTLTTAKALLNLLFKDNQKYASMQHRVTLIKGDLEKAQLGLSPETIEHLARHITDIYHVGATVNHLYSYPALRAANVLSTQTCIHLAMRHRPKKLLYISSLSAIPEDKHGWIVEDFCSDQSALQRLSDGYSQTKWASEYLLEQAAKKGCDVYVIRPGWILSDQSADYARHNHLLALIKSGVHLQVAPNWAANLYFLPVRFVAQLVSLIGLSGQPGVYNLTNVHGLPWRSLIQWLNQQGQSIALIPVATWVKTYLAHLPPDNPLSPFLSLYLSPDSARIQSPDRTSHVIQKRTLNIIKKHGLHYPTIHTPTLLEKYFTVWRAVKRTADNTRDKAGVHESGEHAISVCTSE